MTQQIKVEDAFPVFRRRCSELHDENLLLRAQVEALEKRLAELEKQAGASDANPATGADVTSPPADR